MAKSSSTSWPATPLAAAQRAFDLLCCPPAPLTFDGRRVAGLPDRLLPLDELKRLLINDATPRGVRDAVWRELVVRARRDGPAWVIAAVGIAMPGLRRTARLLGRGWHGDPSDRDSELLTGFLDRLRTVDVDDTRIVGKLIDAAARAVKNARDWYDDGDALRVDGAWSVPPQRPYDHPDWVLARAVAAAVINPEEHQLIAVTRLEEQPLRVVADDLRIRVAVAAAWRRKAERRLVAALATGELDRVSLIQVAARRRAEAAATKRSAAGDGRTVDNASAVAGRPGLGSVHAGGNQDAGYRLMRRGHGAAAAGDAVPGSRWKRRRVATGAAR